MRSAASSPRNVPLAVADVVDDLHQGVNDVLGVRAVALYLHGSLATGGFDDHSDIDFLVVCDGSVADRLPELQGLHEQIYSGSVPWAQRLNGSYISRFALRTYDGVPRPHPYVNTGGRVLMPKTHDDTAIVRWVIRKHGLVVFGPSPHTLIEPVTADDVRRDVLRLLHAHAARSFALPRQLNNRLAQPFIALLVCRMLQSLDTGRVGSKRSALEWANECLPHRFALLAARAFDERAHKLRKLGMPADVDDLALTFEFLRFGLDHARRYVRTLGVDPTLFDEALVCVVCAQRFIRRAGTPVSSSQDRCPRCATGADAAGCCLVCGQALEQGDAAVCQQCCERRDPPTPRALL